MKFVTFVSREFISWLNFNCFLLSCTHAHFVYFVYSIHKNMAADEYRKRAPKKTNKFINSIESNSYYFFYIEKSGLVGTYQRAQAIMKPINELFPADSNLVKGKSYPLDFGKEGMWNGLLIELGGKKSVSTIEKKVSAFLQGRAEKSNLTDDIRSQFFKEDESSEENADIRANSNTLVIESDPDELSVPITPTREPLSRIEREKLRLQALESGQTSSQSGCSSNVLNCSNITPNPAFSPTAVPNNYFSSPGAKRIRTDSPDGDSEVTLSMVYSKLKGMQAYMQNEFRRLRSGSQLSVTNTYSRTDFIDEQHTGIDGNTFTIKSLKKTSSNAFIRDFALRKYGKDFLTDHVVDPARKGPRTQASTDVVAELKRVLFLVFKPMNEDSADLLWNGARRSLNQMFAESTFANKASEAKENEDNPV